MSSRVVLLSNLGRTTYDSCMKIMKGIVECQLTAIKVAETSSLPQKSVEYEHNNTIILTEHQPTYTVGFREVEFLAQNEKERLESLGADFAITDRGGLVTFHGPGQLMEYVNRLEEVGIASLKHFNIDGKRTENIGVWVGNNKIISVGVKNQKLITSHGFCINCNNDLKWFNHIVACGLYGKGSTSIKKESGNDVTIEDIKPIILDKFSEIFDCEIKNSLSNI